MRRWHKGHRIDVGRRSRIRNAVVASQSTRAVSQGELNTHRLANTYIGIVKGANSGQRKCFTVNQSLQCTHSERCTIGSVIGFVGSGTRSQCQTLLGQSDCVARAGCGQVGKPVVTGQTATGCSSASLIAQGDGVNEVTRAHVLGTGSGSTVGQRFAADPGGDRDCAVAQGSGSVIGPSAGQGHFFLCDRTIGARQGAAPAQVVVGGVGATQRDRTHGVGQIGAYIFLCKRTVATDCDHIIGL